MGSIKKDTGNGTFSKKIVYWVIDTRVRVLPRSTLPQDGSDYYFGRSVVPDSSKSSAVERLKLVLEEDFMYIDKVINVVDYKSKNRDARLDDDFDTKDTFESAQACGDVSLGCFISELSM